ncbi:hypothetical protein Q31a_39650 [Aureliella helgolandensis]|uniref:Uncharacterized protein n=1 Tax=Aureliella helgolandensis TaxID=2527968 RepID=A0A518GAP5_9BACT|nr:hypothetical protein Q31a_39650 [Aureliella helgolandensis]
MRGGKPMHCKLQDARTDAVCLSIFMKKAFARPVQKDLPLSAYQKTSFIVAYSAVIESPWRTQGRTYTTVQDRKSLVRAAASR